MTEPLRIFLCEDAPRMRAHLARVVRQAPDLVLVGEAATAETAEESLRDGGVDVLLLDLELPGMDGIALLGRLSPPPVGPDVLILTTDAQAERVFLAMRRGAAGYLVKGVGSQRLCEAIREVASGGTIIEPRLARRFWSLFEAHRGRMALDGPGLTDEEVEVLTLVARGLTNPEVSTTTGQTPRRVKTHLESIYRKLDVAGRVEAVLKATSAGVIQV